MDKKALIYRDQKSLDAGTCFNRRTALTLGRCTTHIVIEKSYILLDLNPCNIITKDKDNKNNYF